MTEFVRFDMQPNDVFLSASTSNQSISSNGSHSVIANNEEEEFIYQDYDKNFGFYCEETVAKEKVSIPKKLYKEFHVIKLYPKERYM